MKYPNRKPYNIPSIMDSLAAKVRAGKMTLREAAEELARSGWNFGIISEDYAREALHIN